MFPQTAYFLVGFTGYEGRTIYPLLSQVYIENAKPAKDIDGDLYVIDAEIKVKSN